MSVKPEMPPPNFDLIILIGPGVIIALAGVLIYWLKTRRPNDPPHG